MLGIRQKSFFSWRCAISVSCNFDASNFGDSYSPIQKKILSLPFWVKIFRKSVMTQEGPSRIFLKSHDHNKNLRIREILAQTIFSIASSNAGSDISMWHLFFCQSNFNLFWEKMSLFVILNGWQELKYWIEQMLLTCIPMKWPKKGNVQWSVECRGYCVYLLIRPSLAPFVHVCLPILFVHLPPTSGLAD